MLCNSPPTMVQVLLLYSSHGGNSEAGSFVRVKSSKNSASLGGLDGFTVMVTVATPDVPTPSVARYVKVSVPEKPLAGV